MSYRNYLLAASACVLLTGCGGGGAPTKEDVQEATEALAAAQPDLFGDDKPLIKETTCSETGKDMYDCVTILGFESEPDYAQTITVKMTKLGGKWTAQIPNIMQ